MEPDELEAMVAAARMPGIAVVKTASDETPGAPGCWLGGAPTLPPEIDWPVVWTDQLDHDDEEISYPMHFLAQFDLSQLPRTSGMPGLPAAGTLFFFADYLDHVEPRGMPADPSEPTGGGFAVIYTPGDVSRCPPRPQPPFHPDFDDGFAAYWWLDRKVDSFRRWPVTFEAYEGVDYKKFPNTAFWTHAIGISVDEGEIRRDALYAASAPSSGPWGPVAPRGRARKDESVLHRLFGARKAIGASGAGSETTAVRLFTIVSDQDLDFRYADQIGFFIDMADLEACRFDRSWAFTEGS